MAFVHLIQSKNVTSFDIQRDYACQILRAGCNMVDFRLGLPDYLRAQRMQGALQIICWLELRIDTMPARADILGQFCSLL